MEENGVGGDGAGIAGVAGALVVVAGGPLRSRLPVTNSRSTASRKSCDRAETLENRACASWRSAVTTSMRFFTPYLYASSDAEYDASAASRRATAACSLRKAVR